MRLKRLEIFGFKSFFDKTVITFQDGITGVVGPNGCGKSNIADAILWVMGEQSPKSFRGERMEDVIFSGTEQRKPLSVAEVSLTIGDIARELPAPYAPYAELTFSRRLYRSGESDYLINKNPCRLKDIRDLLIDTGAGYRAHTIIGQGKVNALVSATPMQRREIVEEAAGIAKYRLRKAEALRKLEATERNLSRVSDIIGELNRQRKGLDRQAKKAARYREFTQDLQALECQLAYQEWQVWVEKEACLAGEEKALEAEALARTTKLSGLEQAQSTLNVSITEKEALLQKLRRQLSETEMAIQGLEGKIETLRAECKGWRELQTRSREETAASREGLAALHEEKEGLELESAALSKVLPEKEQALSEGDLEVKALEQSVRSESAALEKTQARLFHLASQASTAQNNLLHFQSRLEALRRQQDRLLLESDRLAEKRAQSASALQEIEDAFKNRSEQFSRRKEVRRRTIAQIEKTQAALSSDEKRLAQITGDIGALVSEISSRQGFYRGLLGAQEGAENGFLELEGLHGMVADFIEVPAAYESAIEAALEKCLNGIVMENHAAIRKGLARLKSTKRRRGIFFPRHPRVSSTKMPSVSGEGFIGCARDLTTPCSGYEAIADALLRGVMIVEDLNAALRFWRAFPEVPLWVSLEGEVLSRSGMLAGGAQRGDGLLEQKRGIQERSKRLESLQLEQGTLKAEISKNQGSLESLRKDEAEGSEAVRALEVALLRLENERRTRKEALARFGEEAETIAFEQEECLEEEVGLKKKQKAEQLRIEEAEDLKKAAEAALAHQKTALAESREKLVRFNEIVVQLRMEMQSLKEKKGHLLEKSTRLQRDAERLQRQVREKEELVQALQKKLESGEAEAQQMRAAIEQMLLKRRQGIEAIRSEQEAHAALLSEFKDLDAAATSLRSQTEGLQAGLKEKALKKVEARMSRQKIVESIAEKYHIEISAYQPSVASGREAADGAQGAAKREGGTLEAASLEALQVEAEALRRKVEALGPVNLAAIEEYRELDGRYQFLCGQEADLTKSIEGLREVISKINKTTRGLFIETFHKLNRKFGEVFTSFFGGGQAELVLLDPAQPLESGIDMLAQPPGKGKRNLMLFSGGEKALTAISMLFATFLIHPTPFCLLDEIDAPLDEENTRRFTEVLLEMSRQTQFIIVTHNKFTMEIADVLYGVTMEETGLSTLVSVNLKNTASEGTSARQMADILAPAEKA